MSRKKIVQLKESKWLRIWDLLVYGIIAVIIVALFLVVFFTRDSAPTEGIKLSYNGVSVFEYDYVSDKYEIKSAENIRVDSNSEKKLELTFFTDGKSGYNKILIDKVERSVTVTDADCSTRRDCVYSPAIKDNSSVICCTPHSLTIEPLKRAVVDDGDIDIG